MSVPVVVSHDSTTSASIAKTNNSRRQLPERPSQKESLATTPDTHSDDVVVEFRRPGYAQREVVVQSSPPRRSEEQSQTVDGKHYREHLIMMEYKLLAHNCPPGIYVVPSLKSLQVWHGIIFVRQGPFAGGAFRFEMVISDSFPQDAPLVKFVSKLFHPQVQSNGLLNLAEAFPNWRPGEDRLWHVMQFVYDCFGIFSTWQPSNERATVAIHESMDVFRVKAIACVQESIRELESSHDDDDTSGHSAFVLIADHGNCLQYPSLRDDLHIRCKYMMRTGELPVFESEEKGFVSWIRGRVSSLLGDLESSSERWVTGLLSFGERQYLQHQRHPSGGSESVTSRSDTGKSVGSSSSSRRSSLQSEVKRL